MLQFRASLCKAIAPLETSATAEEASNIIGPIISSAIEVADGAGEVGDDSDNEGSGDGVTPLMVACDKGLVQVLQIIRGTFEQNAAGGTIHSSLTALFGHPTDKSSAEVCGGNTAGHHAAMSGCKVGMNCLAQILMCLEQGAEPKDCSRCLLQLLSQRNSNGDTPIMMACASGNASMVEHWIAAFQNKDKTFYSDVRGAFHLQNDSGDTALSLASGHGFHSIATILVDGRNCEIENQGEEEGLVRVSHEELEKTRAALNRIDALVPAINKRASGEERNHFHSRRRDIQQCIEILTSSRLKAAERSMSELLGTESNRNRDWPKAIPKKKKGSKTKKKSRRHNRHEDEQTAPGGKESPPYIELDSPPQGGSAWKSRDETKRAQEQSRSSETSLALPYVVTLEDGTVISAKKRTSYLADEEVAKASVGENAPNATVDKNVDDLLRDRYRDQRDPEIESIMDSLCLDVSMLLLTSHGMAMELSPSQLDAIESVMKTQLGALREAKDIQKRILCESK